MNIEIDEPDGSVIMMMNMKPGQVGVIQDDHFPKMLVICTDHPRNMVVGLGLYENENCPTWTESTILVRLLPPGTRIEITL